LLLIDPGILGEHLVFLGLQYPAQTRTIHLQTRFGKWLRPHPVQRVRHILQQGLVVFEDLVENDDCDEGKND
jgi:hypothetical protein